MEQNGGEIQIYSIGFKVAGSISPQGSVGFEFRQRIKNQGLKVGPDREKMLVGKIPLKSRDFSGRCNSETGSQIGNLRADSESASKITPGKVRTHLPTRPPTSSMV